MTDAELLKGFEDRTLPFSEWTHRAHVRVAYCYLTRFPLNEALDHIRSGIKAYNAHNQVPEGPTRGYNETTTVAFARIIHATIVAYGTVMPTETSDAFCEQHPHLMTQKILRLFYSPSRRMHPDAKHTFVEPDLAPLPDPSVASS